MAGFYQDWIVTALVDLSMRNKRLEAFRGGVVSAAEDRVLEIGVGSGFNLPFYIRADPPNPRTWALLAGGCHLNRSPDVDPAGWAEERAGRDPVYSRTKNRDVSLCRGQGQPSAARLTTAPPRARSNKSPDP